MAVTETAAGTWQVDWSITEYTPEFPQGRRKRLQETYPTWKQAKKREKEIAAQVAKDEFIQPSDVTVGEQADKWYAQKAEGGYRRASLVQWKNHRDHIKQALGHIPVQKLDCEAIENAKWSESLSATTINKVLTSLTDVMAMAKRHKLRKDNPAEEAQRKKVSQEDEQDIAVSEDDVFTQAELGQLIHATEPGSRERIAIMIPALTGIRVGELCALSWKDGIDVKAGKLHVRWSLADNDKGEEPLIQPPKTKSGKRTIGPLPPELIHELKVWKAKCPYSPRELVLAREDEKPMSRKRIGEILADAIEKAELDKKLTPHGLRHTFASLLLMDGTSIPEVSYLLGHKDSYTTMKIYAHFTREESRAVARLGRGIFGRAA